MKKLSFLLALIALQLAARSQFSSASLQATGLTCALCSKAINNALLKLPGIQSVKADIKNSSFDIVFRPGATVYPDDIKNAVEGAGFSVGVLKVTGSFHELAVDHDQHVKIGDAEYHFVNVDKQVLNGEKTLTLVDKNFVTQKEFKKLSASVKMGCMQTGKAGSCCVKDGLADGVRVYHVTL